MSKYNEHIQAIKKNYPTSGYSALCEALDCAVDLMSKEVESAEKNCECTLREPCEYCNYIDFETGDKDDRNKLLDKEPILQSTLVNGNELLQLEYAIGYFLVKARSRINYCPMCGRKLEVEG